jgi:hypothetical protein
MTRMELFFDAINGFDQIVLIAAREGHARDGKLNGNQRLMYCGLLRPIHERKFEPVLAKAASPKKQKPRLGRGFRKRQSADRYLAGALDEESAVDFLCLLLLWLFL